MRKMLGNNLGLKIGSVLAAAVLWFMVLNIEDPTTSVRINDVQVTILNEDAITKNDKVYSVLEDSDIISVKVTGRRSVVSKLKAADVIATADMEELSFIETIPITVKLKNESVSEDQITLMTHNVKVQIEDKAEDQFPITIEEQGTPGDGYVLGEAAASPSRITIAGPESIMKKIQKVVAEVDVTNLNKDSQLAASLKVVDGNNEVLGETDTSRLEFNIAGMDVMVDVVMYKTKDVELKVETNGEPESGYRVLDVTWQPTTIRIAGRKEDLAEVDSVTIQGSALDVTGAKGNIEEDIDITDYLPENMILVDERASIVVVTVKIAKLTETTLELPVADIETKNGPSGLTWAFSGETIEVTVEGLADDIRSLDVSSLTASVDLENYTSAGTYTVLVDVQVKGEFTITSEPEIKMVFKRSANS